MKTQLNGGAVHKTLDLRQINRLNSGSVRKVLEAAFNDYHVTYVRSEDPVHFAHRYPNPKDQEVVAFIASLIAYGNVKIIIRNVSLLLSFLGDTPHDCLQNKAWSLPAFRHRFTNQEDLQIVFYWLSEILISDGSLEAFFARVSPRSGNLKSDLSAFVTSIRNIPLPQSLQALSLQRQRTLKYLIPNPSDGSTCKRLNMFLRWVVRPKDGIDLGLWTTLTTADLILPIDTHLFKIVRRLGWTQSKQPNWKVAEEATQALKLYDPVDPVRFDFSLCHLSMRGEKALKRYFDAPLER